MSVGITVTRQNTDAEIAALGIQLNALFNRVREFNAYVLALGSAGLQALPSSVGTVAVYTSGEATTLLNAAADLDRLRLVYAGLMYVTFGATVNTGTPIANDGSHFGYPFSISVGVVSGFGH